MKNWNDHEQALQLICFCSQPLCESSDIWFIQHRLCTTLFGHFITDFIFSYQQCPFYAIYNWSLVTSFFFVYLSDLGLCHCLVFIFSSELILFCFREHNNVLSCAVSRCPTWPYCSTIMGWTTGEPWGAWRLFDVMICKIWMVSKILTICFLCHAFVFFFCIFIIIDHT